MERQSNLLYYMGMSLQDQLSSTVTELEWMYGWLIEKKKEEAPENLD